MRISLAGVVLGLAFATACTSGSTRLRLDVSGGSAVDRYQVAVGSDAVLADAESSLEVELPDAMAGQPQTVELWGLAGGEQIAFASAGVTPKLHDTVDVALALAPLSCGASCALGAVACGASGVVTCIVDTTGCLAWSAPAACPASAPVCSAGACVAAPSCSNEGASCDDGNACTIGDSCSAGTCSGTPKCTSAPAHGTPTCAADGTCGFTCETGYSVSGASCVAIATSKRVFVTTNAYDPALGGAAKVDELCQQIASGAGLTGTYAAWLSNGTMAAAARLTHATVPYVLVTGERIAGNWDGLVSGSLLHAIDLDANGNDATTAQTPYVWTGTTAAGTTASGSETEPDATCLNYTVDFAGSLGEIGDATMAGAEWTEDSWTTCNDIAHFYCFEQ